MSNFQTIFVRKLRTNFKAVAVHGTGTCQIKQDEILEPGLLALICQPGLRDQVQVIDLTGDRWDRVKANVPAACGCCGGWTGFGGMSQYADGPDGCKCRKTREERATMDRNEDNARSWKSCR